MRSMGNQPAGSMVGSPPPFGSSSTTRTPGSAASKGTLILDPGDLGHQIEENVLRMLAEG